MNTPIKRKERTSSEQTRRKKKGTPGTSYEVTWSAHTSVARVLQALSELVWFGGRHRVGFKGRKKGKKVGWGRKVRGGKGGFWGVEVLVCA